MDYEIFKERFVEDLKDKLYEKGVEADVSVNTVNKLNDSYEAVTINPVDDQIGVNISINKCFKAYEHGTDHNDTVDTDSVKILKLFGAMDEKTRQIMLVQMRAVARF